ncbi:hypothetical protein [Amycolatopsis vastitatis]|uniref:Uncharacterized protein n=1 Tax=Amycolatopsis vastitatis TaxID=1905142 RepID=A0A229TBY1_9PSEU|nr:hypothetical protein [Amycolatopsis vastitatis]OXM68424.1 hypothetical protein CF165_12990 [Amycolatopsis vastitatis]
MTDLDELRRTLRAQESLAPDPGDVLAAATRRLRRRRIASVAAVTLAVAALGVGAVAMLGRGTATAPPASRVNAPPASVTEFSVAEQVPPAAPAVSLEDGSWDLMFWAVQPHFATVHYGQGHRYAFEIEVRDGAAPRSALAAKPSDAKKIRDPQSVAWQDGPGRWIRVTTTKPMAPAETLALLTKIRAAPPVISSPLESLQIPAGQKVDTFTSEPESNTLVLCPDPEARKAPLDNRCFSLTVSPAGRTAQPEDGAIPEEPLPVHRFRTLGAYTIEVDSSSAQEQAASALMNSVRLNR